MRSLFSIGIDGSQSVDSIYHFGSSVKDEYSYEAPMEYVANDPTPRPAPKKDNGISIQNLMIGIGGSPTLVKDSQVNVTYNEEIMWGSGVGNTNRDPRTAVGYTSDNYIIMIVAIGRQSSSQGVSLPGLAEVMTSLGCVEVMNLDGGDSDLAEILTGIKLCRNYPNPFNPTTSIQPSQNSNADKLQYV